MFQFESRYSDGYYVIVLLYGNEVWRTKTFTQEQYAYEAAHEYLSQKFREFLGG